MKTKTMIIKFRNPNVDTEEVRECIEDNLGVEILEIEGDEFKCIECGNIDFEYVDFTAKSVKECCQCKTKSYENDYCGCGNELKTETERNEEICGECK